jgi:hypothetical protein
MTESEWLDCEDPHAMLRFLEGRASDRKLRLFAVACCRRYWDLLRDEGSRTAVLVAERFADGLATREELEGAREEANRTAGGGDGFGPHRCCMDLDDRPYDSAAAASVIEATFDVLESRKIAADLAGLPRSQWVKSHAGLTNERWVDERRAVADLIRDIFGNPFRPATIDQAWLNSNVLGLAQAIYEERAFDRMPELADALEAAGCHDADILVHCRQAGPHVRGCWVVDLILGQS